MGRGGARKDAGRDARELPYTDEASDTPKVNRAIPMTAGEWDLVKAAAAKVLKPRAKGGEGPTPAAEWARTILLDVATGRAVVVPVEPTE
jgi:hypothetical protein